MAKKKGCLGCSLPVAIIILVVVLGAIVIGMLAGPLGKSFGITGLPSWLSMAQPHPHLPPGTVFNIAGFSVTNTIIATWITMAVIILLFIAAFSRFRLVPTRIQSLVESLLGFIYNLVVGIAGEKDGRRFFPLVATIFLFVGFNAWLALVPGYGSILYHTSGGGETELIRGANTDINTTLALALVTFCVTEFVGLKRLRLGYLKKFFVFGGMINGVKKLFKGKIGQAAMEFLSGFISFFTGIIELLGEFIRIVSLTFRLFGNMTAGEILVVSIAYLVPFLVPVVFYGLEILVGFIQALVFGGLTIVYISLAVASHSSEEHGH